MAKMEAMKAAMGTEEESEEDEDELEEDVIEPDEV